jgi:tetratricopeptide (TPR) repeat protein
MKALAFLWLLSVFPFHPSQNRSEGAQTWFAKARDLYEKQDWVKSEEAANKALAIDPTLADAEILLGLISTARRQFQVAETHFQKALSLQPRNDLAQSYLANIYLQQKQLEKAKGGFAKTLQLNPDNQSANYNLGLIALMQQKPKEALVLFEKVQRARPSDVPALFGILQSQSLLNDLPAAKRTASKLASLLKPDDPLFLQVATVLALHQDYASAIPLLEQARKALPNAYDVNFNLALAYYRSGQYERSSEILKPLAGREKNAEAYNLLGSVQERLGEQAQASVSFRQAIALEPANEDFCFDYANHVLQFENSRSAVTAFAAQVGRFPKSWRMRLGLGSAYYLSGENEAAAQALLQAVQLRPDSKLGYFLLGKVYESIDVSQAPIYVALRTYCETKPDDFWAYYHLGTILFLKAQSSGSTDFQEAKIMLERALQKNPKFAEAYLQLGLIAQAEQKWEAAARDLEKATQLDPQIPTAHYRLGLAYQRLGESNKAKTEFELFEKLKSQSPTERDRQTVFQYLAEQSK